MISDFGNGVSAGGFIRRGGAVRFLGQQRSALALHPGLVFLGPAGGSRESSSGVEMPVAVRRGHVD